MGGINRRAKSDSRPTSFSKRNFSGRSYGDGYTKHDDRDSSRGSSLHKAVCHTCGKECEVPFRPNGKKPVFCSICFDKQGNTGSGKFGQKNYDRPRFEERRRPEFERKNDGGDNRSMEHLKEQMSQLHGKLDRILQALETRTERKETEVSFDEPEVKAPFKMKKKVVGTKKSAKKKTSI